MPGWWRATVPLWQRTRQFLCEPRVNVLHGALASLCVCRNKLIAVDRNQGAGKQTLRLFGTEPLALLHVLHIHGDCTGIATRELSSEQCELYVAEFFANKIRVWVLHDRHLTLARWFGTDILNGPQMIALFRDEVFVTECHARRVSVFSLDGHLRRQWTNPWFADPNGIVVTARGEVVITDFLKRIVCVFDVFGRLLRQWSTSELCVDILRPWHVVLCSEHCVAVSGISRALLHVDLFRLSDGLWVGRCFQSSFMCVKSMIVGLALVSPDTLVVASPNIQ